MNDLEMQAYINDRQQKFKRERQQYELAHPPRETRDAKAPVYAPTMARVGAALVEMGQQLQARYGDALDRVPSQQTLPSSRSA